MALRVLWGPHNAIGAPAAPLPKNSRGRAIRRWCKAMLFLGWSKKSVKANMRTAGWSISRSHLIVKDAALSNGDKPSGAVDVLLEMPPPDPPVLALQLPFT